MIEKKVKKIDPEYYTKRAVEREFSPLFSKAKTRESSEIQEAKDFKKAVTKKEKKKMNFTQF